MSHQAASCSSRNRTCLGEIGACGTDGRKSCKMDERSLPHLGSRQRNRSETSRNLQKGRTSRTTNARSTAFIEGSERAGPALLTERSAHDPAIEQLGLATSAEIGIETFEDRIRAEWMQQTRQCPAHCWSAPGPGSRSRVPLALRLATSAAGATSADRRRRPWADIRPSARTAHGPRGGPRRSPASAVDAPARGPTAAWPAFAGAGRRHSLPSEAA